MHESSTTTGGRMATEARTAIRQLRGTTTRGDLESIADTVDKFLDSKSAETFLPVLAKLRPDEKKAVVRALRRRFGTRLEHLRASLLPIRQLPDSDVLEEMEAFGIPRDQIIRGLRDRTRMEDYRFVLLRTGRGLPLSGQGLKRVDRSLGRVLPMIARSSFLQEFRVSELRRVPAGEVQSYWWLSRFSTCRPDKLRENVMSKGILGISGRVKDRLRRHGTHEAQCPVCRPFLERMKDSADVFSAGRKSMVASKALCPSDALLKALREDRLVPEVRALLNDHVNSCPHCRNKLPDSR